MKRGRQGNESAAAGECVPWNLWVEMLDLSFLAWTSLRLYRAFTLVCILAFYTFGGRDHRVVFPAEKEQTMSTMDSK